MSRVIDKFTIDYLAAHGTMENAIGEITRLRGEVERLTALLDAVPDDLKTCQAELATEHEAVRVLLQRCSGTEAKVERLAKSNRDVLQRGVTQAQNIVVLQGKIDAAIQRAEVAEAGQAAMRDAGRAFLAHYDRWDGRDNKALLAYCLELQEALAQPSPGATVAERLERAEGEAYEAKCAAENLLTANDRLVAERDAAVTWCRRVAEATSRHEDAKRLVREHTAKRPSPRASFPNPDKDMSAWQEEDGRLRQDMFGAFVDLSTLCIALAAAYPAPAGEGEKRE